MRENINCFLLLLINIHLTNIKKGETVFLQMKGIRNFGIWNEVNRWTELDTVV